MSSHKCAFNFSCSTDVWCRERGQRMGLGGPRGIPTFNNKQSEKETEEEWSEKSTLQAIGKHRVSPQKGIHTL